MFKFDNVIINLPSKSISEDIYCRDGKPTDESFTPFTGCYTVIRNYIRFDIRNQFDIMSIVSKNPISLFKINEAANNASNSSMRETVLRDYSSMILEDFDDADITAKVGNMAFNFDKSEAGGGNELRQEIQPVLQFQNNSDDEDNEYQSYASLISTEYEEEVCIEDVAEAKGKLPYLLYCLNEKSKVVGFSLLSGIIARAKAISNCGDRTRILKPMDILSCNTLCPQNKDGKFCEAWVREDNKRDSCRLAVAWVLNKEPLEVFAKVIDGKKVEEKASQYLADQLEDCCRKLGINLANERLQDYTDDLLSKAKISYLASLHDIENLYGNENSLIAKVFDKESMFSKCKELTGSYDKRCFNISETQMVASLIVSELSSRYYSMSGLLYVKDPIDATYSQRAVVSSSVEHTIQLVKKCLYASELLFNKVLSKYAVGSQQYSNVAKRAKDLKFNISDLFVEDGVLKLSTGKFLTLSMANCLPTATGTNVSYGLVTAMGSIVLINRNWDGNNIMYVSLEDYIDVIVERVSKGYGVLNVYETSI